MRLNFTSKQLNHTNNMKQDYSASMENDGKPTGPVKRIVKKAKAKTKELPRTKPARFPKKPTSGVRKVTGRAQTKGISKANGTGKVGVKNIRTLKK